MHGIITNKGDITITEMLIQTLKKNSKLNGYKIKCATI